MNNPKMLKLYIAVLIVLLSTSAGFLGHAIWQNSQWEMQVDTLAKYEGSTRASHDFKAGRLRLFVFAGERDKDKYSGTNDGSFEIWHPQYYPQYYPMRYATEQMVSSYNERMRDLQAHQEKVFANTNIVKP
jgi:hypothetical protein